MQFLFDIAYVCALILFLSLPLCYYPSTRHVQQLIKFRNCLLIDLRSDRNLPSNTSYIRVFFFLIYSRVGSRNVRSFYAHRNGSTIFAFRLYSSQFSPQFRSKFFSKTYFTSALSSKLTSDLAFPVRLICNNTMSVFQSSVMCSALGNCHQYFVKTTAYDVNLIISLTFKHRASCILGQAFHYFPENAFYIFNQQIYFII